MDSISQIALGAGVGELVLGKKIGNKAILFGAIAGTIPDLDVFVNFLSHSANRKHCVSTEVTAMPLFLNYLLRCRSPI